MSDNTFNDFIDALGLYHSANRYDAVSSTNHLGRFQLGEAALIDIRMVHNDGKPFNNDFSGGWTGKYGVTSKDEFLASHEAQDLAVRNYIAKEVFLLRDYLHYDGQTINGHDISISGLLAAAHLTGTEEVKRFLKSGGDYNPRDTSLTTMTDSIDRFHDYETPYIVNTRRDYTFRGSDGPDAVIGYYGNDLFVARSGRDTFDGGLGEDTIQLSADRPEYTIIGTTEPSMWEIVHQRDAVLSDYKSIRNVEFIKFADGEILDLRTLGPGAPTDASNAPQADLPLSATRDLTSEASDPRVDEDLPGAPIECPTDLRPIEFPEDPEGPPSDQVEPVDWPAEAPIWPREQAEPLDTPAEATRVPPPRAEPVNLLAELEERWSDFFEPIGVWSDAESRPSEPVAPVGLPADPGVNDVLIL